MGGNAHRAAPPFCSARIPMLAAILLAVAVFIVNLSIQAVAVSALVFVLLPRMRALALRSPGWGHVALLEATLLMLLLTTLVQIGIWAALFLGLDEFPAYHLAFYHSAVNFTTLGYGDIVMSEDARLLGPLEAINGSIMLGLSGATLFATFGRVARQVHGLPEGPPGGISPQAQAKSESRET